MKAFVCIVSHTSDNNMTTGTGLGKFEQFDTLAEAEAHRDGWCADNGFPDAFVVPNPGGTDGQFWKIDPVAKTVLHNRSAREAAITKSNWDKDIEEASTLMPDVQEDIIDSMDAAQLARLPQRARDNHANKKTVRARKP